MELEIKPKVAIKQQLVETTTIDSGTIINLYKTPPYGQLTLEECEDLFRQRLEAYSILEKADMTEKNLPVLAHSFREIKSYIYKTNCIIPKTSDKQQQRLDHFSHMLARMHCVSEPSLWSWFKNCEKRLFNYRLRDQASRLSGGQLENILRCFNFEFERVVGSDLNELKRENLIGWSGDKSDVFKVKFIDALKFVAKRSVSLKDGFAYLTKYEIISVVCDVFEKHLESELNYARRHLDTSLLQAQQLIESLRLVYHDYQEKIAEERKNIRRNQDGETNFPYRIDIDNLDELVKNHYPPCMRHLHEALMQDHHLRHLGRLHYGSFLRSGGVDLDSAIEFWRKEFTKKIANDKFERDYKYNIRHLYGKEGHKKALSCFSCDKIINDNPPGPGDKHGCPFKCFDDTNTKNMLIKHELKEVDIDTIMQHRSDKDYKMACSHYFKFLKGDFPSEPIKNPIHFYYESRRLANRPILEAESATTEQVTITESTNNLSVTIDPNSISEDMEMEEWDD